MWAAFDASLYYPALLVALTLPEIYIALSMDKSEFVKERHYKTFVDDYTTPSELGLDGLDCYRLRGGVVHRANAVGHPKFGGTHVTFTVPETGSAIHALSIQAGDKLSAMFDLKHFCEAMERAVRKWYVDHSTDPKVATNVSHLLRWRPEGLAPFFEGKPVLASGPD